MPHLSPASWSPFVLLICINVNSITTVRDIQQCVRLRTEKGLHHLRNHYTPRYLFAVHGWFGLRNQISRRRWNASRQYIELLTPSHSTLTHEEKKTTIGLHVLPGKWECVRGAVCVHSYISMVRTFDTISHGLLEICAQWCSVPLLLPQHIFGGFSIEKQSNCCEMAQRVVAVAVLVNHQQTGQQWNDDDDDDSTMLCVECVWVCFVFRLHIERYSQEMTTTCGPIRIIYIYA